MEKAWKGCKKKIPLQTWKQKSGFPGSWTQAGSLPIPRLLQRGSNACLKSTSIDLSCTSPRFTSLNAAAAFLSNIVFTNCHPNYVPNVQLPTFMYIYIVNIALFKLKIGYYFSKQRIAACPTLRNQGACNMARRTTELSRDAGRPTISAGAGMRRRRPDSTRSAIHFSPCNKSTLFRALTWARKTEHSIVLVIMHM